MLSMPAGGLKEETETFGTNMAGARRVEVAAMQTVTDIICCLKQMDQVWHYDSLKEKELSHCHVVGVDTSEEYELSSQQCPCILYYTGWCLSIVALLRTGPSLQSTDTDWRLFLTRARRRARLHCRLHQRRKRAKWANVVHLCMNTVSKDLEPFSMFILMDKEVSLIPSSVGRFSSLMALFAA